jgi:hypothetical protein
MQGTIQVDGPARIEGSADGTRLVATFTAAELRWGKLVRWVAPQAAATVAPRMRQWGRRMRE